MVFDSGKYRIAKIGFCDEYMVSKRQMRCIGCGALLLLSAARERHLQHETDGSRRFSEVFPLCSGHERMPLQYGGASLCRPQHKRDDNPLHYGVYSR